MHIRQNFSAQSAHAMNYDDLLKRDKLSLDLFWLRDESLENIDTLPAPQVLAASIIEDLQAALGLFMEIEADVSNSVTLKDTF